LSMLSEGEFREIWINKTQIDVTERAKTKAVWELRLEIFLFIFYLSSNRNVRISKLSLSTSNIGGVRLTCP
jgi:hypothetical protein